MIRTVLSNAQWERIAPELPGKIGDPGRSGDDNRLFVEGVLWVARTGAPWRDLPDEFGKWCTRASGDGRKRACGSGFSSACLRIQTSNMSSSMRRWSGSISMAPAQKGDSKSGHRQIARRPDDEDRSDRRCARQSDPLRAPARPAARHHQLRHSHGRHLLLGPDRRQGI